jgi:hypothetical protein
MKSTHSLITCSMARLQAQFLPTQRSPTGRGQGRGRGRI